MRKSIEITGIITSDTQLEYILEKLEAIEVDDVNYREYPQYDDWLAELPKDSIPGLANECRAWIHHWGNGGGDQSSETCITDAINDLKSDVPAELAEAIRGSVAGYSKTEFDAAGLTIEMIDDCIEELMVEQREKESEYEEDSE